MDLDFFDSELCLAENTPIRLRSAKGVRVICTAGRLWLTVEGEAGDILLAPGDSHLIRGRGLALLEAIGSGRARFARPVSRPARLAAGRLAALGRASRDFVPIPCSHPNCGWLTVFLRRWGLVHNVVRYVDLEKVMNEVAYKTLLDTNEVRGVLGSRGGVPGLQALASAAKQLVRSTDMFSIAIKPFMDRHTYDQDRIANCCHHITDTHGTLRSFCEYNALDRRQDSWGRLPTREQLG